MKSQYNCLDLLANILSNEVEFGHFLQFGSRLKKYLYMTRGPFLTGKSGGPELLPRLLLP